MCSYQDILQMCSSIMAKSKRKKNIIFLINEKIAIFKKWTPIPEVKCLEDRLGITTSTLLTVVKSRKEINEYYVNCGEKFALQRKLIKTGCYFDVEEK